MFPTNDPSWYNKSKHAIEKNMYERLKRQKGNRWIKGNWRWLRNFPFRPFSVLTKIAATETGG